MFKTFFMTFSFTLLLTSIFALKFRYWNRPKLLAAYFVFFGSLEWIGLHYFLPPDALGYGLAYLFLFLSCAVITAIVLLSRHERKHGHLEG